MLSVEERLQRAEAEVRELRARLAEQKARNALYFDASNVLFTAVRDVIADDARQDIYGAVVHSLQEIVGCESVFLLFQRSDSFFACRETTDPRFQATLWHPGPLFRQVLNGNIVVTTVLDQHVEWRSQSIQVRRGTAAVMHVPINASDTRGILICTGAEPGCFGQSERETVRRFLKLAEPFLHVVTLFTTLRDQRDELEQAAVARLAEASEQQQFAQQVMSTMAQGLTITDELGRFTYVNPAFAQMLHYEPEELLGKTPFDITTPDDHQELHEAMARRQRGEVNSYETRLERRDGELVYVLVTGAPRHRHGQLTGMVAVITDLTHRHMMEDALRESEARTRMIIDSAMDGVIVMDYNGLITEWNSQAETIFGWSREQTVGQPLDELILPPDERRKHRNGLRRYLQSGRRSVVGQRVEMKGLHRAGHEFPVEISVTPIRSRGAILFSAFVRDITERKLAEAELNMALKAAAEAAEMKSRFLANMSHEIRTPLNAVIGLADVLLNTELKEDQLRYVGTMRSSGRALLSVINDILDFSRLESGEVELEDEPFDLRRLIDDTLDMIRQDALEKSLSLYHLYEEGLSVTFSGDATRLQQVLTNLLSNAVKFTEAGSVKVTVSSRSVIGNRHQIHFAVSDTGIGIPAEEQQRLFQPFMQLDPSTTRRFGGTGLGLAISRELVKAMGGEFWVESEPDVGSTFAFTARLRVVDETEFTTTETAPDLEGFRDGHSLRILIAEDDVINQQVVSHMLRQVNLAPDIAENGLAVLDALRHRSYDVILMDMHMPEMDGLVATRTIRAQWHGDDAPYIIALTASALPEDREKCLDAGMDEYLSKPVLQKTLLSALQRAKKGHVMVEKSAPPASTDQTNRDPVDPALFAMRIGPGQEELHFEILHLFLDGAPEQIARLRQAVEAQDGPQAFAISHKLKGEAATVAAPFLAEHAAGLTEMLRDKEIPQVKALQLLQRIEAEYERVAVWAAERLP